MSEWIGVIRSLNTGMIIAVINPNDDGELDNPRLLLMQGTGEPLMMVKVPRGDYMGALSMDQVAEIVERITSAL
jgi:hypothetical protein